MSEMKSKHGKSKSNHVKSKSNHVKSKSKQGKSKRSKSRNCYYGITGGDRSAHPSRHLGVTCSRNLDIVEENPQNQFNNAVRANDVSKVRLLLNDPHVNPDIYNNIAIIYSCKHGHTELVRLLLADPRVNPSDFDNIAIIEASRLGHTEVVQLLLDDPRVNPADSHNMAIIRAAISGHAEIVLLLLNDPRVNPADRNNQAIINASEQGNTEVVRLLLADPRVNPTDQNNQAVRLAEQNGHDEVVRLLLADLRVIWKELEMALNNNDIELVRRIVNSIYFVRPPQGSDIYRLGNNELPIIDTTVRQFNKILGEYAINRSFKGPGVRGRITDFL